MRAIDTNVLVRFLVADDVQQAKKARVAIEAGDIFLPATVLLETEWVLRAGYGLTPDKIAAALRAVAGLPGVTIDGSASLATALDWMDGGMDFADAMHLARSEGCDVFLSFDRKLAKAAAGRTSMPVALP